MKKKIAQNKSVETGAKKVRLRTNIQHVLLHTIAAVGVLGVALLAPNAMRALSLFDGGKKRVMNPKYLFGSAFEKLLVKGMIIVEHAGHDKYVRLTALGKRELAKMVARSPDPRVHRRWDKRWRMVIYDIKEQRKLIRMRLQEYLSTFGFYKLQQSVWIYPYDCEALLVLLKADFSVGQEVLYVVVEKIENDQRLKNHFGLK